jgi:uncharacterized protein (TIGR03083 family)
MNLIEKYRLNRQSFQFLGRSLNETHQDRIVAATPEWTIRDVFAHMAGVADDVLAGRLDGVATDPWTELQVQARRDRSLNELLDEWENSAPQLEDLLMPIADQIDPRMVIDLWTHEQDVRGTLAMSGGDQGETLDWIVELIVSGWEKKLRDSNLNPLRIEVVSSRDKFSEQTTQSPEANPGGLLRLAPYEVARVALGRRSRQQILNYEWSSVETPSAYIDLLVAFTPAREDIVDA